MRNYSRLWFVLMLIPFVVFGETPKSEATVTKDVTSKSEAKSDDAKVEEEMDASTRDIIIYGIETEIQNLVKTLDKPLTEEYMLLLLDRFFTSSFNDTKTELAKYFTRCDTIPTPCIERLYPLTIDDFTDKPVRVALYPMFAKHGTEEHLTFLIEKLDDSDRLIQSTIASNFSKSKTPEIVSRLILARLELSENKLSTEDDSVEVSKELSQDTKNTLILALGKMNYQPATTYLKGVLASDESVEFTQMYAMHVLGQLGDITAIEAMRGKLGSSEVRVREYAASALSTLKDPSLVQIYSDMLKHNDVKVRTYACKGIVANNATGLLDILIYKLNRDPDVTVKNEATKAILAIGADAVARLEEELAKKRMIPGLLAVLTDGVVEHPSAENVAYVVKLYEKADKPGKEAVARSVVKSKSNITDPILELLFKSDNYMTRMGATNALLTIENPTLVEKVRELSEKDPVVAVKKNAKRVLDRLELQK